jgi:hypothetical protein
MGILINLVLAAIAFIISKYILAFVGIVDPLNFLIAILIALIVFFGGWRGHWYGNFGPRV